jgi:hypothetical protein
MASIFGDIQGIKWLTEANGEPGQALVEIAFTLGAYTASSDTGQLGGTGTKRSGVSVAAGTTLEQILAADRRDGKTVTLSAISTAVAVLRECGKQGSTSFYLKSPTVSSNNLTFEPANSAGTEIDAASGISDRPMSIVVGVALS